MQPKYWNYIQFNTLIKEAEFPSTAEYHQCFTDILSQGVLPFLEAKGTKLPFLLDNENVADNGQRLTQKLYLCSGVAVDLRYTRVPVNVKGEDLLRVTFAKIELISDSTPVDNLKGQLERMIQASRDVLIRQR